MQTFLPFPEFAATAQILDFRRLGKQRVEALHLFKGTGLTVVRSQATLAAAGELPKWLGDADFHRSHQSALLRKDPEYYRQWFVGVPTDLAYVWPKSDR